MKTIFSTIIATVVAITLIIALLLTAVAHSGVVNIAASADYLPGVEWFFSTLSENSIRRHARKAVEAGQIQLPAQVTDAMLQEGGHHYREMCVVCHGAPGVDRGEIGKGQKPAPPELSATAAEMTPAEIYWVLEHGIRHAGMPAYGTTHSSEELWGLTMFVERLETMTPEEYQRLSASSGEESGASEEEEQGRHDHSGHTH